MARFIFFGLLALLIDIPFMSIGQNAKNYEADWAIVQKHINNALPASALQQVKKIYQKAKAEKQDAQIIKSLFYMNSLQQDTREDNETKSIRETEAEIKNQTGAAQALLKSYLAGIYQGYYNRNRYKLYDRTNTVDFNKEDIATWTRDDFHKKISELYLQSIQDKTLLQQKAVADFDVLITKGNVRNLRPTVYDLLAQRALDYFKGNERDISKPTYAFELGQAEAFAPAAVFVKSTFDTRDSLSLAHKALLVYQELIRFHLQDAKPHALIDVDLQRLQYVNSLSVHPQKEDLYKEALEAITTKYGNVPAAAQAWYLLADVHADNGNNYAFDKDTTGRYELVTAKKILDKILSGDSTSEGWKNAYNLEKDITQPALDFKAETVNVPGEPFRMLVKYKNIDKFSLRIVAMNDDWPTNGTKFWKAVTAATAIKSWQQSLPQTSDYQQHAVEVKVDALPQGAYYLVASIKPDFSTNENILAAGSIYVSHISYVTKNNDFIALHRNTGQPLTDAAVVVWKRTYDYTSSQYKKARIGNFKTDKNGYFDLSKLSLKSDQYSFDITYKGDNLFIKDEGFYYNDFYTRKIKPDTSLTVFFFTDRSLYRPGQMLYFKGIAVQKQGRQSALAQGYSTNVLLKDANGQTVAEQPVKVNEYGSFNGTFQLPSGILNGAFSLQTKDNKGHTQFRVEEYKRPKFYVEFEKSKTEYKLNEEIKITGLAKAYAGNNVDGATVKYRVVREARFPYPWLFRGWWPRQNSSMEIANGEATTDEQGKFVVPFMALPDRSVNPKTDPVFDYKIYADVTDINGEVRSGEEVVSVGYKSLLLNLELPDRLSVDSLHKLSIKSENMSGEYTKASVQVSVHALTPEIRLMRSRYWERPDQFVMDKDEYVRLFPHDIYDAENEPEHWQAGAMVLQQADTTKPSGEFSLNKASFSPGFYVITAIAKDKEGNDVVNKRYVELFDEKQAKPVVPTYFWAQEPLPIEPGQHATIKIGSSANDVFLWQQIVKDDSDKKDTYKLDNEVKFFVFKASEQDRGGYGVGYLFVKHNRVYQSNYTIQVPWANKELEISYETFRDKTLPGSGEKWAVKVSGKKGEKWAAEMLASMYDASLDQFYPHKWYKPGLWQNYFNYNQWNENKNFKYSDASSESWLERDYKTYNKQYDLLFQNMPRQFNFVKGVDAISYENAAVMDEAVVTAFSFQRKVSLSAASSSLKANDTDVYAREEMANAYTSDEAKPPSSDNPVRKNFNETAFFFPDLRTDKDGNIHFSFTMPGALTRWKFQALAHTKELAMGYSTKEIITQKELMVQPNPPRFMREGDKMNLSAKVVNLSSKEISGLATLQLMDAATGETVDGWFKNAIPQQYFTVTAGQSTAVNFPLEVPYQFAKPVTWRIVAHSVKGEMSLSDGEENVLPVLTNRMLVTESMPLNMHGTGSKKFTFDKLLTSGNSESISHEGVTIEYTSNPVWYAVQALPYMMDYPYECAEQTWNRFYANALAMNVANSTPKIKAVFEKWQSADTVALLSNLQKNEELKSVLLEETPWVLQAKNEAQQKKNIALLFDLTRMSAEMGKTFDKLAQMQSPNGGFVWFKGGPDNQFITQYILTGIGHLQKLNAIDGVWQPKVNRLVYAALPYLDKKIKQEYDELVKHKANLKDYSLSYDVVQYLYMRSFFPANKVLAEAQPAVKYFKERLKASWQGQNKYMQAMTALALHRDKDLTTPAAILKSLKESAVNDAEMGMYYKTNQRSWWWYEAPVETQALVIEAFEEVGKDAKAADDLRTWLLKNKQTNAWESTKATAEACYALLLRGSDWLSQEPVVTMDLGYYKVTSADEKQEAGTGYFKTVIPGKKVKPAMGNITLTVSPGTTAKQSTNLPTWGAMYWQYFEDINKITTAATPLRLSKQLFVETASDAGPVLKPVPAGSSIKVGDKVTVRIELRVDRDMEYVHMKDMRAAGFEPLNVLSSYKWQGGLGYYESTKDASTNFFFSYLPKGTYVFEYRVFATASGNFSNGITSIQCMYAPEFAAHSEGIRVSIE
ncbi:MAG: alpha-2-macroglobulin family protein [Niabella sp.]